MSEPTSADLFNAGDQHPQLLASLDQCRAESRDDLKNLRVAFNRMLATEGEDRAVSRIVSGLVESSDPVVPMPGVSSPGLVDEPEEVDLGGGLVGVLPNPAWELTEVAAVLAEALLLLHAVEQPSAAPRVWTLPQIPADVTAVVTPGGVQWNRIGEARVWHEAGDVYHEMSESHLFASAKTLTEVKP